VCLLCEHWVCAYVDATNTGIAIYKTRQFPQKQGFNAGSTLQFTTNLSEFWDPASVAEFDAFVLVGPEAHAAQPIYDSTANNRPRARCPHLRTPRLPRNGTTSPRRKVSLGWALPGM